MAKDENPILAFLPTAKQLAAMDPVQRQNRFTEIAAMLTQLVERAHRDDHELFPQGGSHARSSAIASAAREALAERYGNEPELVLDMLTAIVVDIALMDPVPHQTDRSRGN